jgi:type IV pilus assembly protein PilV
MLVNSKQQSGSSLIEVMVGLFILAIGLLGVLATQIRSMQMNQNAYLYSQAAMLTVDIYEAMHTSDAAVGQYLTNFDEPADGTPPDCDGGTSCSPGQFADWNLFEWKTNIANLLPDGEGQIERDPNNIDYTISVRFRVGVEQETGEVITDTVTLETSFQ